MKYIIDFFRILLLLILLIILIPFKLIAFLFRLIFRRSTGTQEPEYDTIANDELEDAVLNINMDDLPEDRRELIKSMVSDTRDLTFFEGNVEHAYTLDFVSDAKQCPKCHSPTNLHYGNFVYATQIAPRVMFAPAGYFCTNCPTVIVDEELIQRGIPKGFEFRGVLGLDYNENDDADFFKTFNGQKSVYILDENQNILGLSPIDTVKKEMNQLDNEFLIESHPGRTDRKKAKRKQLARKSRKRNRRK